MEQQIDFESERKQLTRKAWGVTFAYVVVLLVLACFPLLGKPGIDAYLDMKPNEVGDLLAGIAGPVAFIWLVYGYFLQGIAIRQQAEELRQNTKALELQADELARLVAAENSQMELMRDAQNPFFQVYPSSWTGTLLSLNVKNLGAPVSHLLVAGASGFGGFRVGYVHALDRNQEVNFLIEEAFRPGFMAAMGKDDTYWISIEFQYLNGLAGRHIFDYEDDPQSSWGRFVKRS